MQLTVEKIIRETDDAVSVVFKNPGFFKRVKYKAGQFLTLKLPIKDKIENRAYSLSSSPSKDKFLRITVKKVDNGLVSNFICNELKEGQKIEVEKPMGSFFVSPDQRKQKQYIMLAAGSGITPIYSILQSILAKEKKSRIVLIYSNRGKDSIIFKDKLEALAEQYPEKFAVHHLLGVKSSGDLGLNYHSKRFDAQTLDFLMEKEKLEYKHSDFLLCGPEGFMDAVLDVLNKKDVAPERIKKEAFSVDLSKLIADSGDNAVASAVKINGVGGNDTIQVEKGKTILQAALDQDIAIPYSCRSGMCSSCKAICKTGDVSMIDGHLLPQSEVDQGFILTCVAFPQSENVEITLPQ